MDMLTKNEANQSSGYSEDGQKALEIKKIEYQQRSIVERMIHVKLQQERLQTLLDELQSMDSDDDDDDDDDNA